MTGRSHVDAQPNENGNGVSCDHAQSPDGLPHMVVRHVTPSSGVFTVFSRGSRIVFFSAALGIQIFGPKQLATVATLSVEYFIIMLFLVMGVVVMRRFYRNHDGDGDDVDTSAEKTPQTGSQHDIEQG